MNPPSPAEPDEPDEPDELARPDRKRGRPKGVRARKSFLLRLPPDLIEELRGWADQEFRSVNGQIEYVLRQATRRRRASKD